MPRTIEITVRPDLTEELIARLRDAPPVIGIQLLPGASRVPVGDIVVVRGANAAAEATLRILDDLGRAAHGPLEGDL